MSISSASLLKASGASRAPATLAQRYSRTRQFSLTLVAPLSAEDAMVQSLPEASPAKWHLARTTWFLEQFVLAQQPGHRVLRPQWAELFNSDEQSLGTTFPCTRRHLLARPTLAEVLEYRAQVDYEIARQLEQGSLDTQARRHLILGMQHEQRHQELLLADIKHALFSHPLQPAYREDLVPAAEVVPGDAQWLSFPEQLLEAGAAAWPDSALFAYDDESPRHRVLVAAHALAGRPVTNGEFRAFVADGGYRQPGCWMSDGWTLAQQQGWERPLYWGRALEREYTLGGWRPLDPGAPVCHLSWFEADAFARWAQARLPTEFEWEAIAVDAAVDGHFADDGVLHPKSAVATEPSGPSQLFGDVWEWTQSAYAPYPGYRTLPDSPRQYNHTFMSGRFVLRGGSCATPRGHVRASYRNHFPPSARWQFSGVRLARDE